MERKSRLPFRWLAVFDRVLLFASLFFVTGTTYASQYGTQPDQSGSFAVGGLGVTANLGRPSTTSPTGTLYFGMILQSNGACAITATLVAYSDPGYTNQVLRKDRTNFWITGPAGIEQNGGGAGIIGVPPSRIAFEFDNFQWNAGYYYQLLANCGDRSRSATFAGNAPNALPFFIMADSPQDALQSLSAVPCPPSQPLANGGASYVQERIILTTDITITSVGFWTSGEQGAYCCSQSFVSVSSDVNATPGPSIAASNAITLGSNSQPGEQLYSFSGPVTIPAGTPFWISLNAGPSTNTNPTQLYGSATGGAPFLDLPGASCSAPTGTIQITSNLSVSTFGIRPPIPGAPTGGPYPVTITNAAPGAYTVTFNPVAGYITPAPSTQNISAGVSTAFAGNYTPINLVPSSSSLSFTYLTGTGQPIPPQSLTVTTSTGPSLSITSGVEIVGQPPFFSVSQAGGSTPTISTVTVTPGLPPGTYTGLLTVSAAGAANSPVLVTVTATVTTGSRSRLVFPVRNQLKCENQPCTEYTANIAAVVDHSMTKAYESNLVPNPHKPNGPCIENPMGNPSGYGTLTDFQTEGGQTLVPLSGPGTGNGACGTLYGYPNPLGARLLSSFDAIHTFNYTGATVDTTLSYDGHPGYDYPYPALEPVYAAVSGCVSYELNAAGGTDQDSYHVLAIIPMSTKPLTRDGKCLKPYKSETQYVVFYLHLASYVRGDMIVYCPSPPTPSNPVETVRSRRSLARPLHAPQKEHGSAQIVNLSGTWEISTMAFGAM